MMFEYADVDGAHRARDNRENEHRRSDYINTKNPQKIISQ